MQQELPIGAELLPPPQGLLLLRQTLVPDIPPKRQRNLVIYAARPPDGKRGVVNEPELIAALEAAAAEAGARLRVFRGEKEGIAAAVQAFSRARAVVGVHGAGLANAVFCAAGTPLLEVRYPGFHWKFCVRFLERWTPVVKFQVYLSLVRAGVGFGSGHLMLLTVEYTI